MELTDSHCHIHFDSYGLEAEEVIDTSREAGVTRLICVGTSLADSRAAAELAGRHEGVWASAGVHPHDAADFLTDAQASESLNRLVNTPKVVAVGEIGLDYYRQHSSKTEQKESLRLQMELGVEAEKPFIFHVRDAWDDFWPIFDSYKDVKGVVHSFSSNPRHLEEVLSRGLYVGLNGIMTFTEDRTQLDAAKLVPSGRLLLETDAPFLAPKPFRGQTCEPRHVLTVAEFLADLRGETLEELAEATTANAVSLFKL